MLKKYQVPTKAQHTLKGHNGIVYVVKFNKDGGYCLSGSADRSVILWNPTNNKKIKTYFGAHNYEITDISIVKDNSRFISVGGDKYAYMWDVKAGKVLRKFKSHTHRITSCAINEDDSILITGSFDSTVKIWDIKAYNSWPIDTLKNFKDSVSKIICKDYEIITSCLDGKVRIFDIRMGELSTDQFNSGIQSMALSNDEKSYIVSTLDNEIKLVEKIGGEVLQEFKGHKATQYTIECRYSFDDSVILTGSEDNYIYVYDVLSGVILNKLKNHCRPVCCVDMSPLKNSFLSSSFDNTITYWTHDTSHLPEQQKLM